MLPMPARIFWSVRNAFSFIGWSCSRWPNVTQLIGSSTGSMPSSASSGTSAVSSSGVVTNISPNVRGSTKRSWPAWVKAMTTWVCLAIGSLFGTRSSWPLMPRWITRRSSVSSLTMRYLPRRWTWVILVPSRRVANCLRVPWRRIDRLLVTSTVLIRLPTISRSSSRRMVSTSGNSGIGPFFPLVLTLAGTAARAARATRPAELAGQRRPGRLGGSLLGQLLGSALAPALHDVVDGDGGEEALLVVRPLVVHVVHRQLVERARRQLLELRLEVVVPRPRRRLADVGVEQPEDDRARRLDPAVQVDGAEDGLHGVGEDRGL